MKVFAARAQEKGLELVFGGVRPEVPEFVLGDATRLQQVLMNLIGNAIKFTATGEVALAVDLARSNGETLDLEFVVRDTGIWHRGGKTGGYFRSFRSGDGSTARRFGGTGLGFGHIGASGSSHGRENLGGEPTGKGSRSISTVFVGLRARAGRGRRARRR